MGIDVTNGHHNDGRSRKKIEMLQLELVEATNRVRLLLGIHVK